MCAKILTIVTQLEIRTEEPNKCASFSVVSRNTDPGVETYVPVSRESDPSGTDGDRRRMCGTLVKAQASARVDVPTAHHYCCSTDQGVQHMCRSFYREKA